MGNRGGDRFVKNARNNRGKPTDQGDGYGEEELGEYEEEPENDHGGYETEETNLDDTKKNSSAKEKKFEFDVAGATRENTYGSA